MTYMTWLGLIWTQTSSDGSFAEYSFKAGKLMKYIKWLTSCGVVLSCTQIPTTNLNDKPTEYKTNLISNWSKSHDKVKLNPSCKRPEFSSKLKTFLSYVNFLSAFHPLSWIKTFYFLSFFYSFLFPVLKHNTTGHYDSNDASFIDSLRRLLPSSGVNSFAWVSHALWKSKWREVSSIDFRQKQTEWVPADKPAAVGTRFGDPCREPVNLVSIQCWTCWADLRATYPQAACRHTGNFNRLFFTVLRSFHPCKLTTQLMLDLTGLICVTVKMTF